MFIKSQFKDYYDYMQKFASADAVAYNRYANVYAYDYKSVYGNSGPWYKIFQVGFCGKVYHGIGEACYKCVGNACKGYTTTFDSFHSFYNYEEYYNSYNKNSQLINEKYNRESKRKAEPYFKIEENNELFIKYNTPIYLVLYNNNDYDLVAHSLTQNKFKPNPNQYFEERRKIGHLSVREAFPYFMPTLKLVGFDRIMPAEQAYMCIESYINGVLGIEYKTEPIMDNDTKINQAGFDKKTSFRGK